MYLAQIIRLQMNFSSTFRHISEFYNFLFTGMDNLQEASDEHMLIPEATAVK